MVGIYRTEAEYLEIQARRKLFTVTALVVAANVFDLISTYIVSPDLANEWNILQRSFGLGWAGIIIAKTFGTILAVAGYGYYLKYRDECYPSSGASREEFFRHFSFGKQATWMEMAAGIPLGRRLGVNIGYFWTGMQVLLVWVACDNLLLRAGYAFPLRHYSELAYHLMQSNLVAVVVISRFYMGNYYRYSQRTLAKAPRYLVEGAGISVGGPAALPAGTNA